MRKRIHMCFEPAQHLTIRVIGHKNSSGTLEALDIFRLQKQRVPATAGPLSQTKSSFASSAAAMQTNNRIMMKQFFACNKKAAKIVRHMLSVAAAFASLLFFVGAKRQSAAHLSSAAPSSTTTLHITSLLPASDPEAFFEWGEVRSGPISSGKHAAIVVETARGSRVPVALVAQGRIVYSGVVESFSLPCPSEIFNNLIILPKTQRAHDEGGDIEWQATMHAVPTSPCGLPPGTTSRIFKINAVRAAGSLLVSALSPPLHADDDVRGLETTYLRFNNALFCHLGSDKTAPGAIWESYVTYIETSGLKTCSKCRVRFATSTQPSVVFIAAWGPVGRVRVTAWSRGHGVLAQCRPSHLCLGEDTDSTVIAHATRAPSHMNTISPTVSTQAAMVSPSHSPTAQPIFGSDVTSNPNACFESSQRVTMASGDLAPIGAIRKGDQIMATYGVTGAPRAVTVIFIPHEHNNNISARGVRVTTRKNKSILLTSEHLLAASEGCFGLKDAQWVPAGTLRRGHCLFDADGFAEQIMAVEEVVPITGLQTIVTLEMNSVPIVEGIRVSPYAVNHALVDLLYVVHRISYALLPNWILTTRAVRAATLAVGDAAVHVMGNVMSLSLAQWWWW